MSPTAVEMLDQLSTVYKRFGVDYYAASQNQRDLLDSIALHEYQLDPRSGRGLLRRAFCMPRTPTSGRCKGVTKQKMPRPLSSESGLGCFMGNVGENSALVVHSSVGHGHGGHQ